MLFAYIALSSDIASLDRQLATSKRRITTEVLGRFGQVLSEGCELGILPYTRPTCGCSSMK